MSFFRFAKPSALYVVLVGDVGSGKSTLVEKISGFGGQSSAASTSVTVVSNLFESPDGTVVVCDTPGSNAMDDQFEHNLNIAHALNFMPVHSILFVIKADTRMDNVISGIRKYAEGFIPEDIPMELLGVCITHMDTVSWTPSDVVPYIKNKLGIETAIFSSINQSGDSICKAIRAEVGKRAPIKITVDGELFLRLFRIDNNNIKILREVRKEVARFELMKDEFYRIKAAFSTSEQMDMHFEFQTWMFEEIIEAQKRLSGQNNFTFYGPQMACEASHVANMTNQLRKVLSDVRIEAMQYHRDVDTNFRKCQYCPVVWQKIEGCDGQTVCGKRVSNLYDSWSESGTISTFRFVWNPLKSKLQITKLGTRNSRKERTAGSGSQYGGGCGRTIEWKNMAPVTAPVEFNIDPSSTKDVRPVAFDGVMDAFSKKFKQALDGLGDLKINSRNKNKKAGGAK